jgi:Spy/CpxP family protein refolding chaperone
LLFRANDSAESAHQFQKLFGNKIRKQIAGRGVLGHRPEIYNSVARQMNSSRTMRKLNDVVVLMTTSNSPFSTAAIFVAAGTWQRISKELYRMKKTIVCALLILTMVCCGTAMYAQAQDGSTEGQSGMSQGMGQGGQHHTPMSTDDRLQHMTKMLNLTSDQQTKIRPILDNESTQMQALRADTSMSREDKMSKMRSIRENSMSQINPILTTEQQQKWQQMQSQHMHQQGGGAMGAPGGDQGAPPPQQ